MFQYEATLATVSVTWEQWGPSNMMNGFIIRSLRV